MKRVPLFGLKEVIREATHRLHSSSFWGLPYRILTMNPKKELLWSLKGIRAYSGGLGELFLHPSRPMVNRIYRA